jgi:hypothetical protein
MQDRQSLKMFKANALKINLVLNEVDSINNENNQTRRSFMVSTAHLI